MKKKKIKSKMKWLSIIALQELGEKSRNRVSPYTLMVEVLSKYKKEKPENLTEKEFVDENFYWLKNLVTDNTTIVEKKPKINKKIKKNINPAIEVDVASKEFLKSYAWRKLRMEALILYGARCQCCGSNPSSGAILNVDHIKPRKLFPDLALDINNLQILCEDCNHGKGNWDQTDWRN